MFLSCYYVSLFFHFQVKSPPPSQLGLSLFESSVKGLSDFDSDEFAWMSQVWYQRFCLYFRTHNSHMCLILVTERVSPSDDTLTVHTIHTQAIPTEYTRSQTRLFNVYQYYIYSHVYYLLTLYTLVNSPYTFRLYIMTWAKSAF